MMDVLLQLQNLAIKRTTVDEFKIQNRGGKGVIGSGQKDEDPVSLLKA